jgi:hypothetical protein
MLSLISPEVRTWATRIVVTAVVILAVMLLIVPLQSSLGIQAAGNSSGQAQAGSGNSAAGQVINVQFSDQPPKFTADELKQLEAALTGSNRAGPNVKTAPVPLSLPRGPENTAARAAANSPLLPSTAPGDFVIFRNNTIPASAIAGGYGSVSGRAPEPSTGNNGKNIFQTGNWYASRSFNNGATWGFLNPYTIFGGFGFCCDQVTLYDPSRDVEFWLLQGNSGLKFALSSGSSLFSSWCVYTLGPGSFGQPATTAVDYNDVALGEQDVYIASNLFPATGGQGVGLLRLPIDTLMTCGAYNYNYIAWMPGGPFGWSFTWKPVQGATNVMYWASTWNQNLTSGSTIRIFSWAENSGTYFWNDLAINVFPFMVRNGGQNCSSGGGVITNWCQFNDSRVKGGALADDVLYFSFDATQGGGFSYPYSRIVEFSRDTMTYLGDINVWASWGPVQYVTLSPNSHGDVGLVEAWSGTIGTTNYYPSELVALLDDYSPSYPQIRYYLFGNGNTCSSGGLYRWGDYFTVRPWLPTGDVFIATGDVIRGNNCGSAGWYSEPHNVVFGRKRDTGSYKRWSSK